MFRENNIGVLMLNGCGLKYSNFQILTMESAKQQLSNIKHGVHLNYLTLL